MAWLPRFFEAAGFAIRVKNGHSAAMAKRLNQKLDCKSCGTIYLDIPQGATDDTLIRCSSCGAALGTWGDLQDDLADQMRGTSGAFDLHDGQIDEKRHPLIKPMKHPDD